MNKSWAGVYVFLCQCGCGRDRVGVCRHVRQCWFDGVCVCKLVLVCLHDGVFCVMVLVCCVGVVGRRARGWVCAWAGVHDECVWTSARGQAWRVDKCATVLRLLGCQARPNRIPRHNDHWSVRQRRTHVVLTAPPCSPAGTQPTKLCDPHFYAARPTTSAGEAAQPARPSQGRCCHATPPTCTHPHICMPTAPTTIPTRTGMRSRCKTTVRGRLPVVHVAATAASR
jgi:hypothetical protein